MSKLAEKLASAQKGSKSDASGSMDGVPQASGITPAKAGPDWERIEAQYRIGTMSLREIAEKHGITEGAIRKRAKRDSWTRDLTAKVKAKADELVRTEAVRKEYAERTEKEAVEVEAQVQARIRLGHRKDIAKSRVLAMTLLDELEAQTANPDLIRQLGEIMIDPDKSGNDRKIAEAFQKATSLGGRVQTMRSLADTLKTLVSLEREAYGLDAMVETSDDLSMVSDDELDARISERIRVAGI